MSPSVATRRQVLTGLCASGLIASGAGRRVVGTESQVGTEQFTGQDDETTQLRADSRNSGYLPDGADFARKPERYETHGTDGQTPSGVAVFDGIVYAVATDPDRASGWLFRIDSTVTGNWKKEIDSLGNCVPTVTSENVLLNGIRRVTRVDNDSNPDGEQTFEALQEDGVSVTSSITLTSDWAYFTTSSQTLRRVYDGSEDCGSNESVDCQSDGNVNPAVNGTPAAHDGWGYASGTRDELLVMNPNGSLRDIDVNGYSGRYHPAVDGEWVYVAMEDGDSVALCVFRAKREDDKAFRDRIEITDDGIPKTVSVSPDTVFVVVGRESGDSVYAIDRATDAKQQIYAGEGSVHSPIISGETVLLTDSDVGLIGLDATDGTERWRHELSGIESHPAVSGERILVGSDEGVVEFRQSPGTVTQSESDTPENTPTDSPTDMPTETVTDTPTETRSEIPGETPTQTASEATDTVTSSATEPPTSTEFPPGCDFTWQCIKRGNWVVGLVAGLILIIGAVTGLFKKIWSKLFKQSE